MSTIAAVPVPAVSRLRQFGWRHPEWWALGCCGAAWAAMMTGLGHGHVAGMPAVFPQQLIAWMLMTAAMMLPAVIPQIRLAARGSFWNRRHRAVAGFLLGYFLTWCAVGMAAAPLLILRWTRHAAVPVVLFLLAAAWQRSGWYRSARRACHRTIPLAPLGWRADRDCVRYGAMVGTGCVRACWPLMLACAATGHGLVAMAGGCLLGLLEAWAFRPPARTLLVGTLGLALYCALVGALAPESAHVSMRM